MPSTCRGRCGRHFAASASSICGCERSSRRPVSSNRRPWRLCRLHRGHPWRRSSLRPGRPRSLIRHARPNRRALKRLTARKIRGPTTDRGAVGQDIASAQGRAQDVTDGGERRPAGRANTGARHEHQETSRPMKPRTSRDRVTCSIPSSPRQMTHDRPRDMERSTAERARQKEARPNKQHQG